MIILYLFLVQSVHYREHDVQYFQYKVLLPIKKKKKNSKGRTARNVTEPIYDLKCLKILRIQDFEGYGRKDLSWG